MTSEQIYFLQILSDYVAGRASAAPQKDVQFEKIAEIAKAQSLGGIIYAQCKDFVPSDSPAFADLEGGFSASVFRYATCDRAAAELKQAFADCGIDMLSFKGLDIAKFHRIPELRTMGDIDVLIHPEDRKAADKLMNSLGFTCEETGDSVWSYKRDVVKVEIHDRMIYEKLSNEVDYSEYFDCVWNHEENGVLSPEMQFVFLMAHTAKHILNCGSGFRPFLDMAFMAQFKSMDWDFVTAELKKIHLYRFMETSMALCRRWFNVELPFEQAEISDEFFNEATEKIFSDGLFGFGNEENFGAHMTKDAKRRRKLGIISLLVIVLRKLFPKENTMAHKKGYSYLFSHKLLRPIAWIYRIFYSAITSLPRSIRTLSFPILNRKEINKRIDFIDKWGL